ncbi:pseudouridine-5'-phosphate glycosidase [Spongiactinospora sp. TRM90649]|uniref:pseudouridine-5'-phosphate glycosidase n=1 Tax=Spongiactinospora sp. TRM90649 TaxID=3031114 RepID=UPI0023F98CEB|nr:pseudouridine-5'-phosphate glycosidase [Spongiactinospora sp. TRM90649]MDF5753536.1 pseudouridine-5'-phosphate glycosidase [Spongiactinospora sp. TRM90649]
MHTIPIAYEDEVLETLREGGPVVALESNVITHGLKYPHNVETALKVEAAVRKGGSVPATICVENGTIRVGMSERDIERFASMPGIPKVSSRDLPVVLAQGGSGATTVASSLVAAELAGIPFFCSAGLGGVHRGAETSMDISSDLIQLTRSKVAVVCAGAKMILDLKLTMEYLETQCVPVISYGSDDFPAFYCASSGIRSPHRVDDEDLIARIVAAHRATGQPGGVVIAVPPRAEDAVDAATAETAIDEAIAQAKRDGVAGQGLTKYLMRAVDKATGGRTAEANMAVLISTAEVGGRLAAAHARNRP